LRGYLALAYIAQKQKEDGKLDGFHQKAGRNPPNRSAAEKHARVALDLKPGPLTATACWLTSWCSKSATMTPPRPSPARKRRFQTISAPTSPPRGPCCATARSFPKQRERTLVVGAGVRKRGRKAEARGEMETALRLKPGFGPAKRDLKRLK
jgi:hypothetical protein